MSLATLLTFNLRYYRRHRLLSLLCTMGICLGVGIVIAVELINESALDSFSRSVDLLSGRATHSIVSGYGHVDERLFPAIWKNPHVKAASPIVEVMALTRETRDEPIRFIGIDPFLDADFRNFSPAGRDEGELDRFLGSDPPALSLSRDLMDRYGLTTGDTLTILAAGLEKKAVILGPLPDSSTAGIGDNLAVMDIAAAQELFGRVGYLERIDIMARGDAEALAKELPQSLSLTDANTRKSTLRAMLSSFQLNLAAMSLLAIFVGVFLIYNFSMFSVLSRREDLSLLLTLGADRKGLVTAFLLESLVLGCGGSVLGIGFGWLAAWLSVGKVSGTITELYFFVEMGSVRLTPSVALTGLAVGFAATIVGTGLPALEVAVTPPILGIKRRSIEDRAHGLKGLLLYSGIFFFAAALVTAWASRFSLFWGFFSAFAMTFAFALFTPGFLSPFSHYFGLLLKKGFRSLGGFLAARTIRASLSRTSIAVAALAVALSMTIGVDIMIHSFRESVSAWLDGSLEGDLYISPGTTKWFHSLPGSLIEALKRDPRVEAMERYSTYEISLDGKPVRLRVVDSAVLETRSRFHFLQGKIGAWPALRAEKVFISESLAYRFGLKVGESVTLMTPAGARPFSVASIVRDYSSDQGTLHMDRGVYERIWHDTRVQSVALFLRPGVAPDEVRHEIAAEYPGLGKTIVSNKKMRQEILRIFDKTFAPTATLKGVSLLVALLGVATALTAILLERSRELRVLGYLGLTPGELSRMNIYQGLIMGLASFLISVGCGLILAYIVIYAINYRSFGWTVDVHLNAWVFGKTFLLTGFACLASSMYSSFRLFREGNGAALREEE
jgi:putative ABC transport system permease protein